MSCAAGKLNRGDLELNGLGENLASVTSFMNLHKLLVLFKSQFPNLLNDIIKITTLKDIVNTKRDCVKVFIIVFLREVLNKYNKIHISII